MSGSVVGMAIDGLVAVLLVVTIGYCIVLNARLKRLRADGSHLRATIGELVTATEIAERAINGLKAAATECDKTLAKRVREAEFFSVEIAREIGEGEKVLERIMQITRAAAERAPRAVEVVPQAVAEAPKPAAARAPSAADLKAMVAEASERLSGLRRQVGDRAA